jgi:glycerol kinase
VPHMDPGIRDREYANWQSAVQRTFNWLQPD